MRPFVAGIKSIMCNFAFKGLHSVSIGISSSIFLRDQFYDWIILKYVAAISR